MSSGLGERYDFFLSRRGSVAAIAREVENVLAEKGYRVLTQDYDIPITANFIEEMHEGIKNSRDLIVLFTADYEQSPYTRMEFTSFEANAAQSTEKRRMVVLRCEEAPLLGLFAPHVYQNLVGVNDLGERRNRILNAAEGRSQALPPPPRPFVGVPPRIVGFTGRSEELGKIDAILMQDKSAAVTQGGVDPAAVLGMGGIGKTSIAIEYAHRFRGLYAGVWWCPAETREGLLSSLAGLSVSLAVATAQEADVDKAARMALRRLAEQRATWLLVYDNASRPEEIKDLLPSGGARLLITSRVSDWDVWAKEVALDVLPLEQAVAFLQNRTGRNDTEGAKTLGDALGSLPLALDHAGAYCKRTQMQFGEYAKKVSSLIDAVRRGAAYPRSVAATFNLAITEAVAQCQSTETLIAFIAQCAPERIPMTLVEGAVEDELERMDALAALADVSLLKHDPFEDGTPAVTMHRLVQAVARIWSEAKGSAQEAVGRLSERLVAIYPNNDPAAPHTWPLCARLTPHLIACHSRPFDDSITDDWAGLLVRGANYLQLRAIYPQAARLSRDALAKRQFALGPNHPDTGKSLSLLAGILSDQGNYGDARPLLERALAINEENFGPEHLVTSASLNNLAFLFYKQDNLAQAQPLFERALAIRENSENLDTAQSLNNLGWLFYEQGDFERARPLIERALAIRNQMLGPEHPDTAQTLNNLAGLSRERGDLEGARRLFERALTIREQVLGPEHPDLTQSLNNLALVLMDQNDFEEARRHLERALTIREMALGAEHPDTAMSLHNLAVFLRDRRELAEAQPLFERALAIQEKALEPESKDTSRTRCNLSRLLLLIGRPSEALDLAQTAVAAHDQFLGRDHVWTKDSARVAADALDALGRAEEAKALRERYGVTPPENPHSS